MNDRHTTLKLTHDEVIRLIDAMQSVHEPLQTKPWPDQDRHLHSRLVHRLNRAQRRLFIYEPKHP